MPAIVNSSISSSDPGWGRFFRIILIAFAALFIAGYSFILIVDPYGSLPISFDLDRGPVTDEQRFFHPLLARKGDFDSAVIGSSSARMLNPDELNPIFESRFVNLAMNNASVFEQEEIYEVFIRNHPSPKTVIFGIDHVYYKEKHYVKHIGIVKAQHFPEWMYDEDPWNDLPPYNLRTLRHAWKQFKRLTGLETFKYRLDGYDDYSPDRYDIDLARRLIYGSTTPKEKKPLVPAVVLSGEEIKALHYPALRHLRRMLERLPEDTLKIVLIMPYHYYHQAAPGSREFIRCEEFKKRLAETVCRYRNTHLLDFMIESPLTTRDENYLDGLHYTAAAATLIARSIATGVFSQAEDPDFVRGCPRAPERTARRSQARLRPCEARE